MENKGTITSWHSYGKIYALGHSAITELLYDPVLVEEKIDGSQFSFGVFDGQIKARSKGQEILLDSPEKMLHKAVEVVKELKPLLVDGYTYRGEYLQKPKHNALAYDRVPYNHIIIFDISPAQEKYLSYEEKKAEADRLGLECVPKIYEGKMLCIEDLNNILERTSVLGGQKIEGVVIKNYSRFGRDGKALLGKYVSEAFKEVHKSSWTKENPKQNDILTIIKSKYRTEARWLKALQHIKERGEFTGTPKDIAALIKETKDDVFSECIEEIKEELFNWAKNDISRYVVAGLPEWYKQELAKQQFGN